MQTFTLNKGTMKHINGFRKENKDLTIHDVLSAGDISPHTPIGQITLPEFLTALQRAKSWYYKRARRTELYGPFSSEIAARADAIARFPL